MFEKNEYPAAEKVDDPMEAAKSATHWSAAAEWYSAGFLLVHAVVLFAYDASPSNADYANWTYQDVLLARHVQGIA